MRPTLLAGTALLSGTAILGCTSGGDGPSARTDPTPPPVTAVVESLGTLPPIRTYTYPTGPEDVVVQIATSPDGRREYPLLTVYGDRRAVGLVGEEWRTGTVSEFGLQSFLERVEAVGLLDEPLELRNPAQELPRPDITVHLRVDGTELQHRLDLARIERPTEPRAFLQEAALRNVFDLTEPYAPGAWLTCTTGGCQVVDEQRTVDDRPVLPHEDRADLRASGRPPER